MQINSFLRTLLRSFAVGCLLLGNAWADPQEAMEYGEEINEICAGCHGEYGQGSLGGEYPRLAGMDRDYLIKQLHLFKQRKRMNIPMLPFTNDRELPEEDIQAVTLYLTSIKLPVKLAPLDEDNFDALERLQASKRVINIARYPGDVEAGLAFYQSECANCHGRDGYGKAKKYAPMLAGQRSEYLLKQFAAYAAAERLHDDEPDDAELFEAMHQTLTADLLAYLSSLDDD